MVETWWVFELLIKLDWPNGQGVETVLLHCANIPLFVPFHIKPRAWLIQPRVKFLLVAANDKVTVFLIWGLPRHSPFERKGEKKISISSPLRLTLPLFILALSLHVQSFIYLPPNSFQLEPVPACSLSLSIAPPGNFGHERFKTDAAISHAHAWVARVCVCVCVRALSASLWSHTQRAPSPLRSTINMSSGKQLPP